MDVCSKIFSKIMSNRLYKILAVQETKCQFGATPNIGCQDGSFTLKSLLHLRREHNLPTFVAFVDLVKAYDTANHKLMFEILNKYGAPPKLISAIERMYSELKVVLKIGKEISKIDQTVGVRQGDPMSPVLFLFIMSAFAETLEQEWETASIPKASFHHTPLDNLQKGQLISHPTSKSYLRVSDIFEIIQTLFVDDGAFIFESREDLTKGLEILKKVFDYFGLEMHLGKGNKASKTECVYFPEPAFFKPPAVLPPIDSNSNEIVTKKTTIP